MLEAAAEIAVYVGSEKHKYGAYHGKVGRPGVNPTTVEQAASDPPEEPFTMICPEKWNNRDPGADATALLRSAIRLGQIGHPIDERGLPKHVWARDPEDGSIVYEARRTTYPDNGYKAYPLIAAQAAAIGIDLK